MLQVFAPSTVEVNNENINPVPVIITGTTPLPSGAATEAKQEEQIIKQDTEIAQLGLIFEEIEAMGDGIGGLNENIGIKTDAPATDLTDATLIAIEKSSNLKLDAIKSAINYLNTVDHLINTKLQAIKEVFDNPIQVTQTPIAGATRTIQDFVNPSGTTHIITQPFVEFSIVMNASGTIDGIAVPAGYVENCTRKINADVTVTGTDFIITKFV